MRDVTVLILHRPAAPDAGPLERLLVEARAGLADRHAREFAAAGARFERIVGERNARSFGEHLRTLTRDVSTAGIVVLGSGALPLATRADRRRFVDAAAAETPGALANNRYSADAVAIAGASVLRDLPDLPGDNALPRWLEEVAGVPVRDLAGRWRLGVDLDSPLDLLLPGVARAAGLGATRPGVLGAAAERLAAVLARLDDRRAEVLVAGRTSAATLGDLETRAAARVRAFVEERGLRAASRLALADADARTLGGASTDRGRPPRSILGRALDVGGPGALGAVLAPLCDAAIVDTRVLLAHRLGADEDRWPPPEDRFASDLLLPETIRDPWLRELTTAARDGEVPVLLGGHTLVGPGLRLLLRRSRGPARNTSTPGMAARA